MSGPSSLTPSRFALGTLGCLGVASLVGCGSRERAPAYTDDTTAGRGGETSVSLGSSGGTGGSTSLAPPEDTSNLCGNEILPALEERPNLFLVLDRSGSMNALMGDEHASTTPTKYEASVGAIHDVLFSIGHRTAYGAAVFPSFGNIEDCSAGNQIDSVKAGDSVTYARSGLDGPHLESLMDVLGVYAPEGATPTAATLEKLLPTLTTLEGKTTVILTTDGAPNCNEEASCTAAQCIANIEGALRMTGEICDSTYNCCASTAEYGPYNCIDEAATLAPLAEMLEAGIKTYVIGLPGSEPYQAVMNAMAQAGGTARERTADTEPGYYLVEDGEALVAALKSIVASISISCTVTLDEAPPDWSQVNVYFDNGIVAMDEEDGWRKVSSDTLELVGESCALLESGDVFQIQVVSGCPTVVLL